MTMIRFSYHGQILVMLRTLPKITANQIVTHLQSPRKASEKASQIRFLLLQTWDLRPVHGLPVSTAPLNGGLLQPLIFSVFLIWGLSRRMQHVFPALTPIPMGWLGPIQVQREISLVVIPLELRIKVRFCSATCLDKRMTEKCRKCFFRSLVVLWKIV